MLAEGHSEVPVAQESLGHASNTPHVLPSGERRTPDAPTIRTPRVSPSPTPEHSRFDRLVVVTQPWAFVLGILSPGRDIAARRAPPKPPRPFCRGVLQKCQPVCLILLNSVLGVFRTIWVGRSRQNDPPQRST